MSSKAVAFDPSTRSERTLVIAAVNVVLDELTTEAETFVRQGTDAPLTIERQVSMRYKGQGWEIPVTLPDGEFDDFAAERLGATFTKAYEEFFGRAIDDLAIEAVSWAVRVASSTERPDILEFTDAQRMVEPTVRRPIFDPVGGETVDSAVVERANLVPGDAVTGPGVIIESQTTTVLGSHHTAVMQSDGTLRVTRGSGGVSTSSTSKGVL